MWPCLTDRRHSIAVLLFLSMAMTIYACASGPLVKARQAFYKDNLKQAVDTLKDPDSVNDRDRLLYFMEKGLLLHYMGRYKDSIDTLLKASRLMAQQDVISVSEQSASLVINEWMTEYKGEYSERLWVHTYLMMDYLLTHKSEDALVEAKQALKLIKKFPDVLKKDYFTRTLIAHCYEVLGEYNDAYIEFKKLADDMPDPSPVAGDVARLGKRLGFNDPEAASFPTAGPENSAELILFVAYGEAPVKKPGNIVVPPAIRFSWPQYEDRGRTGGPPKIMADNRTEPESVVFTDMGQISKAALKDRAVAIVAKETARVAAKETFAHSLEGGRNGDLLAFLVRLAFIALEEPDTRSWETLPASLSLCRLPLAPGTYQDLVISVPTGEHIPLPIISLADGEKKYMSIRSGGAGPIVIGKRRLGFTIKKG